MDLPYKRRIKALATKPVQVNSKRNALKNMFEFVGRFFGGFFRLSGVFFASMLGAIVASFASVYFTLTTLESFKAEEALRQFAIADMYRPLREQSAECLSKRSLLASEVSKYAGYLKVIKGYADQFQSNERLRSADFSGVEVLLKPILEQMSAAIQQVAIVRAEVRNCEYIVNNMALEIATVLGMIGDYEKMRNEIRKSRPKFVNLISDNDPIFALFANPKGTIALFSAFKDGYEGDALRMTSALSKLKKQFDDSVAQSTRAVKYEDDALNSAYEEDFGRTRLFLINLKARFEVTPRSTLSMAMSSLWENAKSPFLERKQ